MSWFRSLLTHTADSSDRPSCVEVQAEVDALPRVACDDSWIGEVTIESVTVVFDGEPSHALIATRTPTGDRSWGSSSDVDLMEAAMTTELVGTRARRDDAGTISIV